MRKVTIFGALTALSVLLVPAARAQDAGEVERLRKDNEHLKKEVELLKKENEQLKKELQGRPTATKDSKTEESPPRTKASVGLFNPNINPVDYELVKCVRDGKEPTRVTFTFAVREESGKVQQIGSVKRLDLSTADGKA